MTKTIEQIETSIALVTKGINQLEASTRALRAELGQDDRAFVVGYPFGLFLGDKGGFTGVLDAKLFGFHAHAAAVRVRNGAGQFAVPMTYDGAIDLTLRLNADTLKLLNDCLHGLYEERNAWEDAERAADEGEYYDQFSLAPTDADYAGEARFHREVADWVARNPGA